MENIISSAMRLKRLHWNISSNADCDSVKRIFEIIVNERQDIEYLCVYTSLWKAFEIFYDIFVTFSDGAGHAASKNKSSRQKGQEAWGTEAT